MSDKKAKEFNRREVLKASGGVAIATAFGASKATAAEDANSLRWGFVGTGGIANSMARVVTLTDRATLSAVSSRRMESAQSFARNHGAQHAFDSWADLIASDHVDAIYVATPTSVREEICIAAANHGKHVLGEKPFASYESVQRIVHACQKNDVCFMDGTHFVHHPRTTMLKGRFAHITGQPWSVASAFQFGLADRSNIRYSTELEPMGAIGDAGWYNMRAAVEYLRSDSPLKKVSTHLRRDEETGAAISGSGLLIFEDGSTSTWNCGFDSGAPVMDLRITGPIGVVNIDDFLSQSPDNSGKYLYRAGGWGPDATRETATVESKLPGAALMFDDFAAAVADKSLRDQWMNATLRTQALLDAAWDAALKNEA